MKSQDARELGKKLNRRILAGETTQTLAELEPVLTQKIPFRIVGLIGETLGTCEPAQLFPYLDLLAETHTQGGWVIIGAVLRELFPQDPEGAFDRCAGYIILGDVWYATDILGERVPGPALVSEFQPALKLLEAWRNSPNRWVRRSVGVAVHFWAKRSRGDDGLQQQAAQILSFLNPLFDEREIDAVKGIGWGLKTIGRMYPHLLAEWLLDHCGRKPRAIMLHKALTYLPSDQKDNIRKHFAE